MRPCLMSNSCSFPVLRLSCLCFPRWYPGDWLGAHQDVHAAQKHRGQAEAVLQVRRVGWGCNDMASFLLVVFKALHPVMLLGH